ncbi:MAG: glycosyltransferase [Chloroflexi bacterium]|nr:glycosyltransferase [Chloroflexota bacterium]
MGKLHVLMITSEWPTPEMPYSGVFVKRQADALRAAGVEVEVFSFRGAKRISNYLRARRAIRKQLAGGGYDLVHAHWGQSAILALPKKLPLVVTFHGTDIQGWMGGGVKSSAMGVALRAVSKMAARFADEVILVSERLARFLPKRPYHIVPMGLDTSLFRPMPMDEARRHVGLPTDRKLVLFAASPERPEKRYALAQEAVALLNGNHNGTTGLSPLLIACKDVPQEQMPYFMNASDVLCLTSQYEGSPTVVKEALACNLPIVSVDVGDVRERIGSIEGCVVCDNDNAATIAAALSRILGESRRIEGRALVIELDERALAEKVVSIYKRAISRV